MNLSTAMNRKAELSNATPERYRGLRAVAESISLANVDGAICELMNEALARLVALAYEQDAGGLANIDNVTGKILIPLPWGSNGASRWGLRPQEANILRQVLFDWEQGEQTLLRYDRTRKSWFINLFDFGNYHLAKRWLAVHQITIAVYRDARAKRLYGA